jgi:predicted signal transduction protein with EAL and GGDEF domain
LDDFGAGHAGLNLLARFQPDIIKLDMDLVRDLDASLPKRIIIDAVVKMCADLGVRVIAEGIETQDELDALRTLGVRYIQGYLFAKPAFEALPAVALGSETAYAVAAASSRAVPADRALTGVSAAGPREWRSASHCGSLQVTQVWPSSSTQISALSGRSMPTHWLSAIRGVPPRACPNSNSRVGRSDR